MKTMKKSMFITTIMMVVLLVVALSTATFAWYTAQSNVTVSETTIMAAQSGSASLAIDKTGVVTSTNSSITLTVDSDVMPMIPNAAPIAVDFSKTAEELTASIEGATAFASFTGMGSFYTATIDNEVKFNEAPRAATPATIKGVETIDSVANSEISFYVINTNKDNAKSNVKANVAIKKTYEVANVNGDNFAANKNILLTKSESGEVYTPVAGDAVYDAGTTYYKVTNICKCLRIAMFVDGKYVATWAGEGSSYYGTIQMGHSANEITTTYTTTANGTEVNIGTIEKLSSKQIQLVIWYDGVVLGNADAGANASFTVSFQ